MDIMLSRYAKNVDRALSQVHLIQRYITEYIKLLDNVHYIIWIFCFCNYVSHTFLLKNVLNSLVLQIDQKTIRSVTLFPVVALVACIDTDNGAQDNYYKGCSHYTSYPHQCGGYDDSDFFSNQMCCACGGGNTGNNLHILYEKITYSRYQYFHSCCDQIEK